MYGLVLTDGKIVYIKFDGHMEWCEKTRTVRLFNEIMPIAIINMDNVVGLIHKDYIAESDDVVSRKVVKDGMTKYGFRAPDMTVTEFVEDCLPSVMSQPYKTESEG